MVTIERRIGRLLRYRKIWYPDHEAAFEIGSSLRLNELVRLFAASVNPSVLPHLVGHRHLRTAWIDLTAGRDDILNGMRKKSCRYEIRRAEKMLGDVSIESGTAKSRQDFLTVYNDFASTKKLPKFRPNWLREYAAHADIFVLYFRDQPLCCHLLLRDPDRGIVRLLYSGSRRLQSAEDSSACGPLNRYLHWHEIQLFKNRGYLTFDFGGVRDPEEPISRFKLSFGARIVTEHYCVLGGMALLARLGSLVYERLRQNTSLSKSSSSAAGLIGAQQQVRKIQSDWDSQTSD